MLDLGKSRIVESDSKKVHSSVVLLDEGQFLVSVIENGVEVVKPATGGAGEIFAGVSMGMHATPTVQKVVENLTVPGTGPYTVTLRNQVAALADIGVVINGAAATVAAGVPGGAGAVQLVVPSNTLTFHSGDAGRTLIVTYTTPISAAAAALIYGQGFASGLVGGTGQVGVVSNGEPILTDYYDPNTNWTLTTAVKLAANGKVSGAGGGTTLANVRVMQVPTADSPFLGLRVLV